MSIDIAIPFRLGPRQSVELRYCLRSFEAYLPMLGDGECFLLGDEAPDWYTGGLVITKEDHKLSNISKVIAKLHHFAVNYGGEEFVYANDDTFLLKPWTGMRFWNKRKTTPSGYWGVTVDRARFVLKQAGKEFLHDYEMHVPLMLETKEVAELLGKTDYRAPIAFRTLYCNYFPVPDMGIPDCKIMNFVKPTGSLAFMSTDDAFVHLPDLHKWWQEKYPNPSRWEKR